MQQAILSKLLVFRAGDRACALRVEEVSEVVPIAKLANLAGQPPLVDGFLNLRGEMIPVMQLSRLLNLPAEEPSLHAPIVIVRTPILVAGFVLDSVDGVAEEFELDAERSRHLSFNGCADAEARVGGESVTVLAAHRLLLEQERQCVMAITAQAQSRLGLLAAAGS